MPQAKIEIIIDSEGKVTYTSPLPPPITNFYLDFVKLDLLMKQRVAKDEKQIVVPTIIPPTRPEG